MVRAERGTKKGPGPTPERVLELVQEAREVAKQFGCSVVVNAPGENGTASIPIGKTPELSAFTPDQQHVIFPPEGGQVISSPGSEPTNGKKKKKPELSEAVAARNARRAQNMSMFSGIRGKTVYEDGRPVNVKRENGNKHKKNNRRNGSH